MIINRSVYSSIVDKIVFSTDYPVYLDSLISKVSSIIGLDFDCLDGRINSYINENKDKFIKLIYNGIRAVTSKAYFSDVKDTITLTVRLLRLANCPIPIRKFRFMMDNFDIYTNDYEFLNKFSMGCLENNLISFYRRKRTNDKYALYEDKEHFDYIGFNGQYDESAFYKWPNANDDLNVLKVLSNHKYDFINLKKRQFHSYLDSLIDLYEDYLRNQNIQSVQDFTDVCIAELIGNDLSAIDKQFYNRYVNRLEYIYANNKMPIMLRCFSFPYFKRGGGSQVNLLLFLLVECNLAFLNSIIEEEERQKRKIEREQRKIEREQRKIEKEEKRKERERLKRRKERLRKQKERLKKIKEIYKKGNT